MADDMTVDQVNVKIIVLCTSKKNQTSIDHTILF